MIFGIENGSRKSTNNIECRLRMGLKLWPNHWSGLDSQRFEVIGGIFTNSSEEKKADKSKKRSIQLEKAIQVRKKSALKYWM